jgi:hypothetical protein
MADFNVTNYLKKSFGDTQIDGNIIASGNITASGDVTAFSDLRLKKNIEPLQGETKLKIENFNPISYNSLNDTTGKRRIGLIAQEVESVYPELVEEISGYKSVNYQIISVILIQAVKEQQKEIDELKEKISHL